MPRLRCPEEPGRQGAHPRTRVSRLATCSGPYTDRPDPHRVPGPRVPLSSPFHRRRNKHLSKDPRSSAFEAESVAPPPPPSLASGLDARRQLSPTGLAPRAASRSSLDSRGLVPAVVTTTGGQWGAGRGGSPASAPPLAEGCGL